MKTDPNPQGKGLVPVLDGLVSSRPRIVVPPKQIERIAGELFTSMFVLESEFSFKPVVGKSYYLYYKEGRYRLSLIEPDRWSGGFFGQYVGECKMEPDVTWTLHMSDEAAADHALLSEIQAKKQAFESVLESAEKLEELLPVYYESLPYYSRLFASALAYSLGVSMELSGIKHLSYEEAKGLLPFKQEQARL